MAATRATATTVLLATVAALPATAIAQSKPPPGHGLTLNLSSKESQIVRRRALFVKLELKNEGGAPIEVPHSMVLGAEFQPAPLRQVFFRVDGPGGRVPLSCKINTTGALPAAVSLAPGAALSASYELTFCFELRAAGPYSIQAFFVLDRQERPQDAGTSSAGQVSSNVVHVTLVERRTSATSKRKPQDGRRNPSPEGRPPAST